MESGGDRRSTGGIVWTVVLGATGALMLLAAVASIGFQFGPAGALASVVLKCGSAWPAVVYLVGAYGLGRLGSRLWAGARERAAMQFGVGLAMMLTASHLLGVTGLLHGASGVVFGLGVCVAGIALAVEQGARSIRRMPRARRGTAAWLVGAPAVAVLVIAACSPPGWLWDSEFGGYDVLSYHLQLPQEWLAMGALRPIGHNVYSYLPGYVEAAYLHIAAMTGAPRPTGDAAAGLLASDGWRAFSCQMLHAGLAVCTAWLVARATVAVAARWLGGGASESGPERPSGAMTACAGLAGAVALATPWAVVTGSLAYNEMGMLALMAAAMVAAVDPGLSHTARGVLAGGLVGAACCVKPTALLFATPMVGVLMVAATPRARWAAMVGWGACAGAAMLAPWLVRNALHGGNPVFPFLSGLFGTAHWTEEQASRYAAAHVFDGSLGDRLRLLVVRDEADPAGPRHRGMLHAQWGVFFPLLGAAGLVALMTRARMGAALLLVGLAFQLLAWLFVTHLQSRFLLPMLVPGAVLAGLGLCGLAVRGVRERRAAVAVGALAAFVQTGLLLGVYAGQRGGQAGALLPMGTDFFVTPGSQAVDPDGSAVGYLNRRARAGMAVYLLGEAAPFYYTGVVVYNTTWDGWPLAEVIGEAPNDPAAWSARLRERGVSLVLVSFPELERLRRSGYADPHVTPERVRTWLETGAEPVRAWPATGQALYVLTGEDRP